MRCVVAKPAIDPGTIPIGRSLGGASPSKSSDPVLQAKEWSDVHLDFDPRRWRLGCAAIANFAQIFAESSKAQVFASDRIEVSCEFKNDS
jgi:hypothetical protein